MVSPLSAGVIADVVRRLAVRDLPGEIAFVEIDRRDAAVRRLEQRKALDVRPAATAFAAAAAAAPPPGAATGAGAFGSGARPEMKSMSERFGSLTRPRALNDEFVKM